MIKRSIPWYNQPQYRVKIAAEYIPYVSTARVWNLPPTLGIDARLDNISAFAKTGTIAVATSSGGVGVKGDGTTGLYSRGTSVTPQAMWMAVQFVCNSVTTTQKVAYSLGSAAASLGAYCAISSGDSIATNLVFQLRAIDSAVAIGKTGPVPVVGNVYSCIAVFPSNLKADAYAYVNGVKYTTDFTGSSNITFVGASTLANEAVGALKRGTTAVYSSDTVLFTARGLGQIPESLAKRISENPYSLLQPQQRNIYVSVAGSALNITASLATATASGITAGVDRQLAITGPLATATASGLTANIDKQLSVAALLGTAAASGLTANVDIQTAIAGALANATANGITASVGAQTDIAASLATATATGITATIDQQLAITATLATATADGTTATISNGLTIAATLATATAAGFNANIDQQIAISGSLAAAIADGLNASISFGNDLNISAYLGTATASGLTAGVDSQTDVTATIGQAAADGFSASVTLASSWTGEPFNFSSPITRTFDFSSSITKNLNFESPI